MNVHANTGVTNNAFFDLVKGDAQRIAQAVTTGAQWEIWMQTELAVLFVQQGWQAAREVPYPAGGKSLDLLVRSPQGTAIAIELKAESATNAGQAGGRPIRKALEDDWAKIRGYDCTGLAARWVATVAYSAEAKKAIEQMRKDHPTNITTADFGGLTAVLIDVR